MIVRPLNMVWMTSKSFSRIAEASGFAESTILRFEICKGGILAANLAKLQNTLEDGGIIFIPADANGGPGA